MMTGMVRFASLAMCVIAGFSACSKSAANQDKVSSPPPSGGQDVIAVPQGASLTADRGHFRLRLPAAPTAVKGAAS